MKGRAKWLKKLPDSTAAKDVKKDVKKVQKVSKKKEYLDVPSSKKSTWALDEQMTAEALDKRVAELVASRGKKNTDTREVLRQMELLTKIARLHGPRKEIPVQMHLVSAMYDAHRSIDDYMGLQQWRTCFRSLMRIMTLLEENEKLVLGTLQTDELAGDGLGKAVPVNPEEDISEEKSNSVRVTGSMESFIIRLEEEYTKSLQQINPHTQVHNNLIFLVIQPLLFTMRSIPYIRTIQ